MRQSVGVSSFLNYMNLSIKSELSVFAPVPVSGKSEGWAAGEGAREAEGVQLPGRGGIEALLHTRE